MVDTPNNDPEGLSLPTEEITYAEVFVLQDYRTAAHRQMASGTYARKKFPNELKRFDYLLGHQRWLLLIITPISFHV